MAKTDDAVERLKSDILRCELAPGAPLVVAGLSARYGLGWTPLREALSRLEAEQLVISERNRGYRVAPVSAASIRDLQVARQAVEEALLTRSIASGDADWEDRLVATHHRLSLAPALGPSIGEAETAQWENAHDAFHTALLAAGQSSSLMRFQQHLTEQLRRHHRHMIFGPGRQRDLDEQARADFQELLARTVGLPHHTAMMEATLARDAPAAVALLREHVGFSLAVYAFLWPEAG
ncbi:GntR family transcriptional regulator [Stappia sp.]|jgi:DNA-binding GntR family transcriptional regulator|uniref:GntR family transcriptional regulator n=1 Tax=Stappia sp. TaxID=1870903 RepID=UPI003A9A1575